MENITCELNGIKYLLVEMCVTDSNKLQVEHICRKYQCIQQGIKKIDKGGFLTYGYAIIAVLVPEKNVIDFNKEKY